MTKKNPDELAGLIRSQKNDGRGEIKRQRSDFKSADEDKEIKDPVERELVQGDRARDEKRTKEWTRPLKEFQSGGLQNNDPAGPVARSEDPERQVWKGDDSGHIRTSVGSHEARVAIGFNKSADRVRRQYDGPLSRSGKLKIGESPVWISSAERREFEALIGTLRGRNATIMEGIRDGRTIEDLAAQFGITSAHVSRIIYNCKAKLREKMAEGMRTCPNPACGKQFHRAQGIRTDESTLSVKERADLIDWQQEIMAQSIEHEAAAYNAIQIFCDGDKARNHEQREAHDACVQTVRAIEERLEAGAIIYCSLTCAPQERGFPPWYWRGKDYRFSVFGTMRLTGTQVLFPRRGRFTNSQETEKTQEIPPGKPEGGDLG